MKAVEAGANPAHGQKSPHARLKELEVDWMSWLAGVLVGAGFGGMFVAILWLLSD